MWGGGIDMGQGGPFLISVGAELNVGQSITVFHGDAMTFKGGHGGGLPGHDGGFVIDFPAKVLHLTSRGNGASFRKVSSPAEDENDGATIGPGGAATDDEGKVTYGVVTNTSEVGGFVVMLNQPEIVASDNAVGTTVDKATVKIALVLADIVGGNRRGALRCGR